MVLAGLCGRRRRAHHDQRESRDQRGSPSRHKTQRSMGAARLEDALRSRAAARPHPGVWGCGPTQPAMRACGVQDAFRRRTRARPTLKLRVLRPDRSHGGASCITASGWALFAPCSSPSPPRRACIASVAGYAVRRSCAVMPRDSPAPPVAVSCAPTASPGARHSAPSSCHLQRPFLPRRPPPSHLPHRRPRSPVCAHRGLSAAGRSPKGGGAPPMGAASPTLGWSHRLRSRAVPTDSSSARSVFRVVPSPPPTARNGATPSRWTREPGAVRRRRDQAAPEHAVRRLKRCDLRSRLP